MEDNDLKDIMLEATAEVQEIMRELLQELAEPREQIGKQMAWMQTPDDIKDQAASENPEEIRALLASMQRSKP